MAKKKDNELCPEEFTGLKITEPQDYAAGMKALTNSAAHILREMGPARGVKILNQLNQKGGVDCPGCAWPDPDGKRTFMAEYCENGVKAIAEEATEKKAGPEFFAKYSIDQLGAESDFWLGKQGRLTHPMIIREGETHYSPISWNEAFSLIGDKINKLDDKKKGIYYTSGRTSNEAAFLYQLLVRKLGTNNLPDCSNMCHESSGAGLSETVGIGKGSVTLEDIHHSDLVMVIGQNPGTNHPRMLAALKETKRNGGKIITVNPLPEAGLMRFKDPQNPLEIIGHGTDLTDVFVPVTINGDVAFLKAIMLLLFEAEEKTGNVIDKEFINSKTHGFELFKDDLLKYNFNDLASASGVSEELIRTCAQMVIDNKNMIICWAMGLTQHKNGVHNIREVVNLLLMRGSIGKKGAGTCPVRGHSNVQGDRTMGIWEKPKEGFLKNLEKEFNFSAPREHGHDVVSAIEAMHNTPGHIFVAMGGNFLSATPDTYYTAKALRNCDLTVHVSTKPNRSHVVHGKTSIILPCLARTEQDPQKSGLQFVTVENSMGVVHSSQGRLKPHDELLKSEPAIIAGIAKACFPEDTFWDNLIDNYDNIRNKIEAVIPGFENYNTRVRKPEGFYLPNNSREGDFTPTSTQKANFTINDVPVHNLNDEEYLMMTIRTHDQYNTTIYGLDDRYRGIYNERRVILMNEEDMKDTGLKNRDVVSLTSHFNGEKRYADNFIVVKYPIPRKCTATYFPESNVLVPIGHKADKSHTPASKSIVITIQKA